MAICDCLFEMARSTLLNKSILLKKGMRDCMYSIIKIIKTHLSNLREDL